MQQGLVKALGGFSKIFELHLLNSFVLQFHSKAHFRFHVLISGMKQFIHMKKFKRMRTTLVQFSFGVSFIFRPPHSTSLVVVSQ